MKKLIFIITAITLAHAAMAQKTGDIIKRQVGEGVKEGATIATEHAADKVTDKVLSSLFHKKNKKSPSTRGVHPGDANAPEKTVTSPGNADGSLRTYSNYDFVPGQKVLLFEDFSRDAIGDFPENWNTNAAAEVVTASGYPGRWLMLNKKGIYQQNEITDLPENFTYEYELVYHGINLPFLQLLLATGGRQNEKLSYDIGQRSGVLIGIQPSPRDKGGLAHIDSYHNGNNTIDNQVAFENAGDARIKISVWRQKQRLRVYVNQEKVFDLPQAFASGSHYDAAMFELWSDAEKNEKLLISNIKLAAGDPDVRKHLIGEGRFSTTGILFDVNEANIKPESYGTLKDVAGILRDNPDVHIKIIGHTDSDGDPGRNLILSKQRAEAVKSALETEFKIAADRMETDGKGSSDPASPNTSPAGKAQNRRVEFVKL